jgi:hypothetical protein
MKTISRPAAVRVPVVGSASGSATRSSTASSRSEAATRGRTNAPTPSALISISAARVPPSSEREPPGLSLTIGAIARLRSRTTIQTAS